MKMDERFMPYNLQFFAEGEEGGEAAGSDLDELTKLLNQSGDEPPQEEDNEPTQQEDSEDKKKQIKPQEDKAGHAFAQMRVQNNQLLTLLSKVANAAGIEYTDNNDLLAKLNDDSISKLAEKQNVPVELLKRMEQLEQRDLATQQRELQQAAFLGFQKVKDTYSLTEDELRAFAMELDAAGKNPFEKPINLETEYKLTHFDDIVTKKATAAVQAALAKSSAADKHSSKPNSATGKPDSGSSDKISTVAGLNNILKDM